MQPYLAAPQKITHKVVAWPGQQFKRFTLLNDLTVVHEYNIVGQRQGFINIVRDQHDGAP